MKLYTMVVVAVAFLPLAAFGQFRSQSALNGVPPQEQPRERTADEDTNAPSGFLGLDLSHFSMHQSLSFSFMSMGGQSLGVNAYTNTLLYQFSPALRARADISLLYSPINNLGPSWQNSLNGLQLSNVSLEYKPARNLNISVSMQRYPYGTMNSFGASDFETTGFGTNSSSDQTGQSSK